MGRKSLIKLKNWWLKKKIIDNWNIQLQKTGKELHTKKNEIIENYLACGRRKDASGEAFFKGQIALIEWLTNSKLL